MNRYIIISSFYWALPCVYYNRQYFSNIWRASHIEW